MQKLKYGKLSRDRFGAHSKIINLVGKHKDILEVGCVSGYMSREIVKRNNRVWGVDIDPVSAKIAKRYCQRVIIGDIERTGTLDKLKGRKFDRIILADTLEHLKDPPETLSRLVKYLKVDGTMIISVPNIAFLTNRILLLLGKFDYTDYGIMDRSHLRFFTRKTLTAMIKSSGLKIVNFDYVANFTQLPLFMQTIYPIVQGKDWFRRLEYKIAGLWKDALAVQFVVVCKKNGKS